MREIRQAQASTRTTSFMHVKNSAHHSCFMAFMAWGIVTKKIKERTKAPNLITDHVSVTFVNLSLASMLNFQV